MFHVLLIFLGLSVVVFFRTIRWLRAGAAQPMVHGDRYLLTGYIGLLMVVIPWLLLESIGLTREFWTIIPRATYP